MIFFKEFLGLLRDAFMLQVQISAISNLEYCSAFKFTTGFSSEGSRENRVLCFFLYLLSENNSLELFLVILFVILTRCGWQIFDGL